LTRRLRLGLLGAGRWGRVYIRSIGAMPQLSLAAVASGNPETPTLVPPGCRVTTNWHEVISASDVDAIVIATPPELHFVMIEAALLAGKPVLVEKPFTCNLAQAEKLVELAQHQRVCLMVDHTHLFSAAFRALQAALPMLGPIRSISGRGHAEGPFRDVPVLWDWAPHDISMALALLGPPITIAAARTEIRPNTLNAETIAITLNFKGSVKAELMVSNIIAPKKRWLEVVCADGTLTYDDLADNKLVQTMPDSTKKNLPIQSEQPLTVALREFEENARGPFSPQTLDLALEVMRVLTRCATDIAR